MAAEPEKRIEESLHAYARKRREEAGAPLEMHPATRRMLQGEVAKLRAAQAPERRAWWQSLFLIWPRFAAAVGMFAVLAVGVWVFTQSEGRRSSEVGQVAYRASEDQKFDDLARGKDRAEAAKEIDRLAPSASTVEEAGKKLAEKRAVRSLDESKVQLRDLEKAPATPAATPPAPVVLNEVLREKQVVKYDAPAQEPAKLGVTLQGAGDKSTDLSLFKQPAEGERFYRAQNGRAVQSDTVLKESLGANGPITTAGVTLEPSKPVDAFYAFQLPQTNAAGSLLGFAVTNPSQGLDIASRAGRLPAPASGPVQTMNEGAVSRQVLARSEFTRDRGVQAASGVEAALGQRFETQDATALLQKFELQQHANGRISIRDADGTVYEGVILAAKTDSDALAKAKAESGELRADRKLERTDDLAAATAASVSFRASGTNRSRELVVISGELLREEDQSGRLAPEAGKNVAQRSRTAAAQPTAPAQAAPALRPQSAAAAADTRFAERTSGVSTSAVFTPTAIRGRVQIGKTNQQELRAIRSR